jgi:hypothetical protein
MKEIRKQKKKRKRSEPTGPISAQPAHLAHRSVRRILCAARSAANHNNLFTVIDSFQRYILSDKSIILNKGRQET